MCGHREPVWCYVLQNRARTAGPELSSPRSADEVVPGTALKGPLGKGTCTSPNTHVTRTHMSGAGGVHEPSSLQGQTSPPVSSTPGSSPLGMRAGEGEGSWAVPDAHRPPQQMAVGGEHRHSTPHPLREEGRGAPAPFRGEESTGRK